MSSSRIEGCTLSGALSVTTAVRDAITIIHGPAGCAHHNVSLFHTLLHEQDVSAMPSIRCTNLEEREVIFGGEGALEDLLQKTSREGWKSIFVLSTCVVDTIGDDIIAVCSQEYGVPVCYIPTSGFLGGVFHTGYQNALLALSSFSEPVQPGEGVAIIGEKNLEYEVEESFSEIARLVFGLGSAINLRYVRNIETRDLAQLGRSSLNILRDRSIKEVGVNFREKFGTPFIDTFPEGFEQTTRFLERAGDLIGIDPEDAIESETEFQKKIVGRFGDLAGKRVCFRSAWPDFEKSPVAREIIEEFDLSYDEMGTCLVVPDPFPVGTAGMSRLLHSWRRSCHAGT